jgi:ubiquinone biosynthesis protein
MGTTTGPAPRQLRRLREIVTVFIRYGFVDVIGRLRLAPYMALGRRLLFPWRSRDAEAGPLTPPQRLRLAFQDLGPTFIKFGQALSLRADVLSPEDLGGLGLQWSDIVGKLQRDVLIVNPLSFSADSASRW